MPLPRFNPGVPNADLSQVRSFQPSGAQAEASMWNEMAGDMSRVSRVWGEIEDRRVANEQEAAGKVAGADPNFDPMSLRKQAVTMADAAFRKGAVASYTANLDRADNAFFTQVNAESFDDPALLRRRMEQHVDATAAKMPLEIAVDYKNGAMRQVDAYYSNAMSAATGRARSQQKDDIQAGIELSERKLKEMGTPTTPEAQAAYSLEAAKLKVKQEQAMQAGIYTPNQIAVRNQVLQEDLQDGTMYQAVGSQPADMRLDFAMKVAEGKSGTGLDMLSPEKRWRAVQIAQQMYNAEKAQEDFRERTQTKQAETAVWNAANLIVPNPTDPRARPVVENLMQIANTPETVLQATKLRDYVNNPTDTRFATSTPEYADYLQLEAARGNLSQRQLDEAWGNSNAGSRLSTQDWQGLTKLIQSKPKGIVGSNAWDTFVSKLQAEFPVRERRLTGMAGLFAQIGINVPKVDDNSVQANGLTDAQMKANEGLVKQVLLDAQEKISNGTLASESSLTDWGGKKIAEMRQYYSGAGVDKTNRAQNLGPQQQGAALVVNSDAQMKALVNKYRNDREAFARDASNGLLDTRTINTITRQLQGE